MPAELSAALSSGTVSGTSPERCADSQLRFFFSVLLAALARQRYKRLCKTLETRIISLSERRTWGHVISRQRLPQLRALLAFLRPERESGG